MDGAGGIGLFLHEATPKTMNTRKFLQKLALCLTVVLCLSAIAEKKEGWQAIFNGKNLAGWKITDPNPFWKVVEGVLVGENDAAKEGSIIWTDKAYGDFAIECEARWSGEIDSGILFRKANKGKREFQMQLGVSRSQKRDLTGSFYAGGPEKYPAAGEVKNLEKFITPGAWNKYRLEAKGDTFTVWLNGKQAVKYVNANFSGAGPIGLQIHPGLEMKIEFRNVRVKLIE